MIPPGSDGPGQAAAPAPPRRAGGARPLATGAGHRPSPYPSPYAQDSQDQYPEQYPDQYPGQYPEQYPDQYPGQYPGQYPDPRARHSRDPRAPRARRRRRRGLKALVLILVLALAWPVGLVLWANGKLNHVDALSGAADTPGATYLIAGSDKRGSGGVDGAVEGARADTIMLLNVPESGITSLVSIPRDTYTAIPGYGKNKINAAFAFGGPELLVESVERLTGMTVDHYVEVGFGSVTELVDAVGGVELCLDQTVKDKESKLNWKKGCHEANGKKALAFSRMRKQDALGDIGRTDRQRQVVGAVMKKALAPSNLISPVGQVNLIKAGTAAVAVDNDASVIDLAKLAWAFKRATGPDGATGTPTIANMGYNPGGGVGSTVLLADSAAAEFEAIAQGTWTGTDTKSD
jgi:LCP family protein required for cell wall assembly